MTFENYSVQYRELFSDSTQYSTISLPNLSFSKRTRKDNKRLPVGHMLVNNDRKIVSLNQRFISIWKLPQHVVTARCERQVFQFIAEHLENPQSFLIGSNAQRQMELEVREQLKLRDGRSFLYLMKPQWLGKIVVGRIYQFRS
jgi:hypothetical protein